MSNSRQYGQHRLESFVDDRASLRDLIRLPVSGGSIEKSGRSENSHHRRIYTRGMGATGGREPV